MSNPMFQHRHYKAIADVLADCRENGYLDSEADAMEFEDRLIKMFKSDNYNFSESRFRAASNRSPEMRGKDKVR